MTEYAFYSPNTKYDNYDLNSFKMFCTHTNEYNWITAFKYIQRHVHNLQQLICELTKCVSNTDQDLHVVFL